MTIAENYARALFALIEEKPAKGTAYLTNLEGVLERRGHKRLLSSVFSEYRKLQERKERSAAHAHITPEQERTRVLLELYRKLIS